MILRTIAFAIALTVGFAHGARADAVSDDGADQMQLMQRRMQALEDQLAAANNRLADLEQRPAPEGVALPSWLDRLEVSGWVTASYFYNFNDPDNNDLVGANSGVCCVPFQPDANQFTFDQAWFELEHPIDEVNRAGFRFEVAYGRVARLLPLGNAGLGGNNLYIPAAYVQYLAPIGGGTTIQFGKWGTLLGYEVAQAPYNWNITRSNVYNLLQPIDHVGILASGALGETGMEWAFGVVNNVFTSQPVNTDGKAFIGSLGWGNDALSASVAMIYGQDTGSFGADEEAKLGIVDVILEYAATDALTLALNADYAWAHQVDDNPRSRGYGVATYANYKWTERFETTLRMDYVADENDFFGLGGDDGEIYSVTFTGGYNLTDNLKVRGEVRYDNAAVHDGFSDVFVSDGDRVVFGDNDQLLAGVDVTYSF